MPASDLLTLEEGAQLLRLRTAETFARFARRHGIPVLKIGNRVVRVRRRDLERFLTDHMGVDRDSREETDDVA